MTIQRDQGFTREARASRPGPHGARRPRAPPERLHPTRRLQARDRRAGLSRQGQAHDRRRAADGDRRRVPSTIRQKLVDYNQRDAELVLEILARPTPGRARHLTQPLDGHAARSRRRQHRLDRLPLPRRAAPAWPRRAVGDASTRTPMVAGGAVLDSVPGLFTNILVFDFKSLYPSIIRTFNIDPADLRATGRRRGATWT